MGQVCVGRLCFGPSLLGAEMSTYMYGRFRKDVMVIMCKK